MTNENCFQVPPKTQAQDMLHEFITTFRNMGWLNQTIQIKRREIKYRISCSEAVFIAYRVNDYCHISPGIPGWPVCFVTDDHIINDADMSKLDSMEPSARDWLRCIAAGDLELI